MTTTHDISPLTSSVDSHLAGYAEPDPVRRRQLIEAAWNPDGELLDPPLEGRGHDAICALADAVLTHFPDHAFRRTSGIDAHHGYARYSWSLVGPDGAEAITGVDVVETDAAGRLCRVVGFFGPLPDLD